MKSKVVVFTPNNARIFINPPNTDKFHGKPNTFVDPDLSFVTGVEPHFWHLVKDDFTLDEAERLKREIDDIITDEDTPQNNYRKQLSNKLGYEIEQCKKAYDILSKLIPRAIKIEKSDITDHLQECLISHNKADKKINEMYESLLEKWKLCAIIPMSDEERKFRSRDIDRKGVINIQVDKEEVNMWFAWLILIGSLVTLLYVIRK